MYARVGGLNLGEHIVKCGQQTARNKKLQYMPLHKLQDIGPDWLSNYNKSVGVVGQMHSPISLNEALHSN